MIPFKFGVEAMKEDLITAFAGFFGMLAILLAVAVFC